MARGAHHHSNTTANSPPRRGGARSPALRRKPGRAPSIPTLRERDLVALEGGAIGIPLPCGRMGKFDAGDFALLADYRWAVCFRGDGTVGYLRARSLCPKDRKMVYMHRLIMLLEPGVIGDHKNRDPLDCRRENLRRADFSDNAANRTRNRRNKNGYIGVTWRKNCTRRPFCAILVKNWRRYEVGPFATALEAALAYDDLSRRLNGEFATLNFPEAAQ